MEYEGPGWRPLCARCVAMLYVPATVITLRHPGDQTVWPTKQVPVYSQLRTTLDAVLLEMDAYGYRLDLDNTRDCGLRADVFYGGQSLCTRHLPDVVMEHTSRGAQWPG